MKAWYKLDNAAKVFPSITNEVNSTVFRLCAIMTEDVNPITLQKAVEQIYDRFAMFFVRLGKGFFWYYLDSNDRKFNVKLETQYPCKQMHYRATDGYMIRVLYYKKRISLEVFHAISDASGAMEFFKSLLYYYLVFSGKEIDYENTVILADSMINPSETEDSFGRYYQDYSKLKSKYSYLDPQKNSYRLRGTPFPNHGVNVITGVIAADAIKNLAKKYNTTVTGFVSALILYSIYETRLKYERSKKAVMAALPVNLRRMFPSETLRNFFAVVMIGKKMDKAVTLEELILLITEGLTAQTAKEYLQYRLFVIGKYDKITFNKIVPLDVKRIFINAVFRSISEVKRTITISSLGVITLPSDMKKYVQSVEFILYPTNRCPYNCSFSTYNDKIVINFARNVEETDIIQYFFSWLGKQENVPVTVYSNEWDGV